MNFRILPHNHAGFTLVELIVGMTVFAIGLSGILVLLTNTMKSASYSRHEIVVAGLLREQIELVKNIRDTNLQNFIAWDNIPTGVNSLNSWTGGIYTIQNNFIHSGIILDTNGTIVGSPISLKMLNLSTPIDMSQLWGETRLFLDTESRYTHDSTATGTVYASYIVISPLGYTGSTGVFVPVQKDSKNQGYIIDARVIVKNAENYREYDARTTITDWVK